MINSNKPINVWVNQNPAKAEYEIWVFELQHGTKMSSIHFDKGRLIRVEVPEDSMWVGEGAKPFMVVPFMMANYLFPELISALQTNTINFTPVPEATLKGELNATKGHLADMQKITDKLFEIINKDITVLTQEVK